MSETLIASELWDKLSGESKTMEQILEIINTISTPDFMDKFQFLNNANNKSKPKYLEFLQEWFLFSEVSIVKNDKHIQKAIKNDKKLQKIYHQQIFKNDEYNWQRSTSLLHIFNGS